MKKIFVIDTETTGLDPNVNCLWQIAGYYRNKEGKLFSLNFKCCPYDLNNISDEALKVCKMTKEELKVLPPASEVYNAFRNFLIKETSDGEKIVWSGYNCRFDEAFVEAFFKHFDPNDSIYRFFDRHHVDMFEFMRILRNLEIVDFESLKLESVYKMFGLGEETAHDALSDAYTTYVFYQWMETTLLGGNRNA